MFHCCLCFLSQKKKNMAIFSSALDLSLLLYLFRIPGSLNMKDFQNLLRDSHTLPNTLLNFFSCQNHLLLQVGRKERHVGVDQDSIQRHLLKFPAMFSVSAMEGTRENILMTQLQGTFHSRSSSKSKLKIFLLP